MFRDRAWRNFGACTDLGSRPQFGLRQLLFHAFLLALFTMDHFLGSMVAASTVFKFQGSSTSTVSAGS